MSSPAGAPVAFFVSCAAALWWQTLRALLLSSLALSGLHTLALLWLSGETSLLTWKAAAVLVGIFVWHAMSIILRASAAEGAYGCLRGAN
jgi:hypothetical protein